MTLAVSASHCLVMPGHTLEQPHSIARGDTKVAGGTGHIPSALLTPCPSMSMFRHRLCPSPDT